MSENVKVYCRVRPLNENEMLKNSTLIMTFPEKNNLSLGGKSYTFDGVLTPTSTQEEVYNLCGLAIVKNVISGYNGTLFAYGQTSSGKTHTMIGKINDNKGKGLTPRIVYAIFENIRKLTDNLSFLIKISYLEIYMEKIRDLLDISKDNLPICEDINKSTYVKGASERYVSSPEEIFDALEVGKVNKKVAQTAMNLDSSRSHCIFCFYITQEDNVTKKKLFSRLYLVDLAGSEKVSKTASEGQTLEEAKNINKSLSALGNVINALVEGASHVPYRDSKLTRMLQESLGGNAKTTVIICVSPASFNESETKSTILFGCRVKTIKNIVTVNLELSTEEWKKQYMELRKNYNFLLEQNKNLEGELNRWRKGEKVPQSEWTKEYTDNHKEDPIVQTMAEKVEIVENKIQQMENEASKDLYKDLDIKDEEIALLSQNLRRLEKDLSAVNGQLISVSKERTELIKTNTKLQADLDRSLKDMKDIFPALEEMGTNLGQKTKELDIKRKEAETFQETNDKLQIQIKTLNNQIHKLNDSETLLKKIVLDNLKDMKSDLLIIAVEMNPSLISWTGSVKNKLEEELNGTKIIISKIKGETKNFLSKCNGGFVGKDAESVKKLEILEKQIEFNKKNSEERIITILNEKYKADVQMFALKREILKHNVDTKLSGIKDVKGNEKIQQQMKHMIDNYVSDFTEAKQELIERGKEVQELKDKLDLAQAEIEIMHKSGLGLDTLVQIDKREQAKNELKGLEENVNREIITLNTLRKIFLNDLRIKIKRISQKSSVNFTLNDDEEEFLGFEKLSPYQRERMIFLENNLENLTKVHKKLVRENADLRSDMPKMERRLKASSERIKQLEQSLKEAKELAIKERKKYQSEIDRIKENVRNKNMTMSILIEWNPVPLVEKWLRSNHSSDDPRVKIKVEVTENQKQNQFKRV